MALVSCSIQLERTSAEPSFAANTPISTIPVKPTAKNRIDGSETIAAKATERSMAFRFRITARSISTKPSSITTYKLYCQTPLYPIGGEPENGGTGSTDDLYFEEISVDLDAPLDKFREYMVGDPVKGSFAAFEVGANVGCVTLENIRLTVDKEKWPMGFLLCAGPKTVRAGGLEFFDPDFSCVVGEVILADVTCNGSADFDPADYVHAITFEDIYADGRSSGHGKIGKIRKTKQRSPGIFSLCDRCFYVIMILQWFGRTALF